MDGKTLNVFAGIEGPLCAYGKTEALTNDNDKTAVFQNIRTRLNES